jgi:hypothetical protein
VSGINGVIITLGEFARCTHRGRVTLVLFRRRALGELSGAGQKIGARVRKSRQKEAAGAAGAGLMQIEWSEGGV